MVMPPKIPSPPKKEEGARLLDPNLVKPGLNDAADVDPKAPKPKKPNGRRYARKGGPAAPRRFI